MGILHRLVFKKIHIWRCVFVETPSWIMWKILAEDTVGFLLPTSSKGSLTLYEREIPIVV